MSELGETPQDSQDTANEILKNAQRLLSSQQNNQPPMKILYGQSGMLSESLIEISKRAEQLPLSMAKTNDVVWWKTASGTTGYFLIQQPYINEGNGLGGMKSGNGQLLITRKEGHPLGDQRGEGQILGATLGSGLKKDAILKGAQLEYELLIDGVGKRYHTTPVAEMGIIRKQQPQQ